MKTTTTQISETTITTVKKSLTTAYVKVCSHNSVSRTTIERAVKVVIERFSSLKATFGCSHTETLTVLRELVLLYIKLENHSTVVRMLLETTIEIINKEKHSKTLHEAAKTMGSIYIACGIVERGQEMVHEMRLQIVTGSASSNKSSFKLDRSISKVSYVFLVTFEQVILGQMTVSYSELMADLLTETILYESFTRSINNKSQTEVILARAASLREFLKSRKRKLQIEILDNQAHEIFAKQWGSTLRVHSEISFIFCKILLKELGRPDTRDVEIGRSACVCSVAKVRSLLSKDRTQEAYGVAFCALSFIDQQHAYRKPHNIDYGFQLSSLMAGRGPEKPLKSGTEPKLRNDMMELSRKIIQVVLQACRESKIDFVHLELRQLRDLTGLLGAQQNHADLEVRATDSEPSLEYMLTKMINSGSSNFSGPPAKSRRPGPPTPSFPSVAATYRQHMQTKITVPTPFDSAKTFATIFAACGARSTPRHSKCRSCCRNCTRAWATTARPWVCMRTF